jgi:hypothetical protein
LEPGEISPIERVKKLISSIQDTLGGFTLFYEELTSAKPIRERIKRARTVTV